MLTVYTRLIVANTPAIRRSGDFTAGRIPGNLSRWTLLIFSVKLTMACSPGPSFVAMSLRTSLPLR